MTPAVLLVRYIPYILVIPILLFQGEYCGNVLWLDFQLTYRNSTLTFWLRIDVASTAQPIHRFDHQEHHLLS
jgi:hypothetical protein